MPAFRLFFGEDLWEFWKLISTASVASVHRELVLQIPRDFGLLGGTFVVFFLFLAYRQVMFRVQSQSLGKLKAWAAGRDHVHGQTKAAFALYQRHWCPIYFCNFLQNELSWQFGHSLAKLSKKLSSLGEFSLEPSLSCFASEFGKFFVLFDQIFFTLLDRTNQVLLQLWQSHGLLNCRYKTVRLRLN